MDFDFKCSGCNSVFGPSEAICEDWSNPKKSFICPHCNEALSPPTWKDYLRDKQYWLAMGVAVVPMAMGLSLGMNVMMRGGTWLELGIALGVMIAVLAVAAKFVRKAKRPIQVHPWKQLDDVGI